MVKIKDIKSLEDTKHRAKMNKMLKDAILLKSNNGNYIKTNNNKLTDALDKQINEMIKTTGEINPSKLITKDMIDLNLLSIYDAKDNIIGYDITDVKDTSIQVSKDLENIKKGQDYWDIQAKEYISRLKERDKIDINTLSKQQITDLIVENNRDYILSYFLGTKANTLDLADSQIRHIHALRIAESIRELQIREIKKIGYKEFLKTSVYDLKDKINIIVHIDALEDIRKDIINVIDILKLENDKTKQSVAESLLRQQIDKMELLYQTRILESQYNEDKEFYDKRHNTIEQIDKLLNKISKKCKIRLADIENQEKLEAEDISKNDIVSLVALQDRNIKKTNYTTTLVGSYFFNGSYEIGKTYPVIVDKDREIKTNFTLIETGNAIKLAGTDKKITLSKDLKSISDAIGTLIEYKNPIVTPKQLYNFINYGNLSNEYVPQKNIDELMQKLYRAKIMGEIDYEQQIQDEGYQKLVKEYEEETGDKVQPRLQKDIISFEVAKDVVLPNKQKTDYILFNSYPLIYHYAKIIHQIAPIPAELKNINYTPKPANKNNTIQITPLTSLIRDQLINEILIRQRKYNNPLNINNFLANNCNFYNIIDKDNTEIVLNSKQRKDYIKKIETILNNFKDKKWIQDYHIIRKGKQTKHSIQFIFKEVPKIAGK